MDIPERLIDLERAAETERGKLAGLTGGYDEQLLRWREAAAAVQAAIAEHAAATEGVSRYELEMAVKKAARHGQPEG